MPDLAEKDILALIKQVKLVQTCSHPNLLELKGLLIDFLPVQIIMERCSGSLHEHLLQLSTVPSLQSQISWALDTADGLAFLAGRRIIHRDVCSRNVLLTHSRRIKIAKFNAAVQLDHVATESRVTRADNFQIRYRWAAPEAFRGIFSAQSDVWSLGTVCWEMATGGASRPWSEQQGVGASYAIRQAIEDGNRLTFPPSVDPRFKAIVYQAWAANPMARSTAATFSARLKDLLHRVPPPPFRSPASA